MSIIFRNYLQPFLAPGTSLTRNNFILSNFHAKTNCFAGDFHLPIKSTTIIYKFYDNVLTKSPTCSAVRWQEALTKNWYFICLLMFVEFGEQKCCLKWPDHRAHCPIAFVHNPPLLPTTLLYSIFNFTLFKILSISDFWFLTKCCKWCNGTAATRWSLTYPTVRGPRSGSDTINPNIRSKLQSMAQQLSSPDRKTTSQKNAPTTNYHQKQNRNKKKMY